MAFPMSFTEPWNALLASHTATSQAKTDFPNYHASNPHSLTCTSSLRALHLGTGHSLFKRAILPAIASARHSVDFVTCYWADSPTLDDLRETLVQLAASRAAAPTPTSEAHYLSEENGGCESEVLRITIGFSSRSLFQKLFHTSSRQGHTYPPSQWPQLGLPDEATLRRGRIELTVKSLFFTPLSVMHSKYVIVDGERAWVPSCNVSWERWFEGCVEVEGGIVGRLMEFHEAVWGGGCGDGGRYRDDAGGGTRVYDEYGAQGRKSSGQVVAYDHLKSAPSSSPAQTYYFSPSSSIPTIFLPSSHHRNPAFPFLLPIPFLSSSPQSPPITPLNAALLTLFSNAQHHINLITPNVTSRPVTDALLDALGKGVDVTLRTSRGMMVVEQLVTAGTTTGWCLGGMVKRYKKMVGEWQHQGGDLEAQSPRPGALRILYYRPLTSAAQSGNTDEEEEAVLSHFKMSLVDDEYLVLGSGNMDRASWWTSQEIGVLFHVPGFQGKEVWEGIWDKRSEIMYDSRQEGEQRLS